MNWRKIFLTVFAVVSFACLAGAQEKYPAKARFSIGLNAGLPTGKTSDTHTFAFGGFLQETIPIYNALQITINAGYTKFKGKSNVGNLAPNEILVDYPDMDLLAAKAGLRYFFNPMIYLQGDAGIALVLNSPQSSYDAGTAFIYSPQIGVQVPVAKKSVIDLALKYEATNQYAGALRGNISTIGFIAAFGF